MKLYCLGLDPCSSCFVLQFNQLHVLLDCGLELASLLSYLPTLSVDSARADARKEQFSNALPNSTFKLHLPQFNLVDICSVDAIIITNFYNIFALPYISEYTKFKGKIYATEPTIQMGGLMMRELLLCASLDNSSWQTLKALCYSHPHVAQWRPLYTLHDIDNAISKIVPVSFLQEINILDLLTVIPVSSGYCLGSANLVIKTPYEKIVYISQTSGTTRHPESFDITLLRSPHTLILTQPQGTNGPQSKSLENSLSEFSAAIQSIVALGGSVIVPVYSSGIILDLLEFVDSFLNSATLRHVTQYYVSPVCETVLAYADIAPEWLCKQKQDRVYLPETPFLHADMMRMAFMSQMPNIHTDFASAVPSQKVKPYKLANTMKEPRIVYVGHPSCRFGDVVHLIQTLGSNPKNAIILIEPDYEPILTLAPFQPLACKVLHIPLDPRLSTQEAQLLINELRPHHLVIPKSCAAIASSIPPDGTISFLAHLDVVNVPISQRFERAILTKEAALKLQPYVVSGGSEMVASVTTQLSTWDHKLVLGTPDNNRIDSFASINTLWGSPSVEGIVNQLASKGIMNVEVVQDKTDFSVIINHPDSHPVHRKAVVKLSQSTTSITTNDELLRSILTEIVLTQCTTFNKITLQWFDSLLMISASSSC